MTGEADLERRLTGVLTERAARLDVSPGPVEPLIARSRARQRRQHAARSVAAAAVLLGATVLAIGQGHDDEAPAENVEAVGRREGQPETISSPWARVPLRLGLPALAGATVIGASDADWRSGTRPLGPPGSVHQRLRPHFDRYDDPVIDLVAVPGDPWPPADLDPAAPSERLAGTTGRLWSTPGGTVRAAWRDGTGRTVTATAAGLQPDEVRRVLRELEPRRDGRYDVGWTPGLTTVLDLSEPARAGETSRLRYRVGGGTVPDATVTIEVTLGDRDAFEASLGAGGGWTTIAVRATGAARRRTGNGSEARWFEPANDALIRVAVSDETALDPVLGALDELTEAQFQDLVATAPDN